MLHEQMEVGTTQSTINLYVVTYNSNAPSEHVKWLEDEHKACGKWPWLLLEECIYYQTIVVLSSWNTMQYPF
jgi:hypothetical protein